MQEPALVQAGSTDSTATLEGGPSLCRLGTPLSWLERSRFVSTVLFLLSQPALLPSPPHADSRLSFCVRNPGPLPALAAPSLVGLSSSLGLGSDAPAPRPLSPSGPHHAHWSRTAHHLSAPQEPRPFEGRALPFRPGTPFSPCVMTPPESVWVSRGSCALTGPLHKRLFTEAALRARLWRQRCLDPHAVSCVRGKGWAGRGGGDTGRMRTVLEKTVTRRACLVDFRVFPKPSSSKVGRARRPDRQGRPHEHAWVCRGAAGGSEGRTSGCLGNKVGAASVPQLGVMARPGASSGLGKQNSRDRAGGLRKQVGEGPPTWRGGGVCGTGRRQTGKEVASGSAPGA